MLNRLPAVMITGASSGIGATYADRFARRGHDLVLVARDDTRMHALASRLKQDTNASIDVLKADLTVSADLVAVEIRLREDETIGVLVNNAGIAAHGSFTTQDAENVETLIRLNVTALTRLTVTAVTRYLRQGTGSIINVASIGALDPDLLLGAYGATKAFVLALSESLQSEVASRGIFVQALLPGATRTEIWERSGRDVNALSEAMDVNELVDAALVAFDRREKVTFPTLPHAAKWDAFVAARRAILADIANAHPAARYAFTGNPPRHV
jgi:uncharacterized protein